MARVLLTGAAGFIGGYLTAELLRQGYEVVAVDSLVKYGRVVADYEDNPRYRFYRADARNPRIIDSALSGCDHFIAAAAVVGGVGFLSRHPFEMLTENERITIAAFQAAVKAHESGTLRKITLISSSQVFEGAVKLPCEEGEELCMPPPKTPYALQKLAAEYTARAAWEQHGLPYTIVRPFNTVGAGDLPGSDGLKMSHVIPDLARKVLDGQDPLHILGSGEQVRHFIHGRDLARGIVMTLGSPAAENEDFNFSSPESYTIRELAGKIWHKIKGPDVPLRLAHDTPYACDVQRQMTTVIKARERLGFETRVSLDEMLDEVIAWLLQ